jgi:hypothetical protein
MARHEVEQVMLVGVQLKVHLWLTLRVRIHWQHVVLEVSVLSWHFFEWRPLLVVFSDEFFREARSIHGHPLGLKHG